MKDSLITQYKKMLEASKLLNNTNADLITAAKRIDPNITTRDEALNLASKILGVGKAE